MNRTNKERILDYLWSIAPEGATNRQIREGTSIGSHQQVYMLTQELMYSRLIQGEQRGREWVFRANESPAVQLASPGPAPPGQRSSRAVEILTPRAFEELARGVMSDHFGVPLGPGEVPGVPKRFDLISPDKQIVGDAKYFTLVQGQRLPPAKFSIIAEHVWLLEKTGTRQTFLVFGNDPDVPKLWLARYGGLATTVAFYFLTDDGQLSLLTGRDPFKGDWRKCI
jgi:hypothetical protein